MCTEEPPRAPPELHRGIPAGLLCQVQSLLGCEPVTLGKAASPAQSWHCQRGTLSVLQLLVTALERSLEYPDNQDRYYNIFLSFLPLLCMSGDLGSTERVHLGSCTWASHCFELSAQGEDK